MAKPAITTTLQADTVGGEFGGGVWKEGSTNVFNMLCWGQKNIYPHELPTAPDTFHYRF